VRSDRREAFEQLCRDEYAALVRAAYLITGDREESLDLAQEALARAYERWRSVSQLDRPGAWVHRVVVNLAISWQRRQKVRLTKRHAAFDRPQAPGSELLDVDLFDALRGLSPSQRAVVVLRYYSDQSIDDVAHVLGKRPGTVRALASQGLARLRETLPREVNDEVPA
jgi:RNA polymerase sigma-70 factor (sigma-E family)